MTIPSCNVYDGYTAHSFNPIERITYPVDKLNELYEMTRMPMIVDADRGVVAITLSKTNEEDFT